MPVRNEEKHIGESLRGVLSQDYPPDKIEILVADGMSDDRTREIVREIHERHPNVRLIDNPGLIVSTGLNTALAGASGDVVVRVDGHCQYPADYVRSVVDLLRTSGASNAGGVLEPYGTHYISRSIAAGYTAPFSVGGALRGHGDEASVRDVDAVHAGCWYRPELLQLGGFDPELVRNQDDELSFRIREAGKRVVQSAAIRVRYAVRDSYTKLLLQFMQYGFWKVLVIRKHPAQSSLRHYLPAGLCLATGAGVVAAPFSPVAAILLAGFLLCYLGALAALSLITLKGTQFSLLPGVVLSIFLMHYGYGTGFLFGIVRWMFRFPTAGKLFHRLTR